jgi:hypothetical protein
MISRTGHVACMTMKTAYKISRKNSMEVSVARRGSIWETLEHNTNTNLMRVTVRTALNSSSVDSGDQGLWTS